MVKSFSGTPFVDFAHLLSILNNSRLQATNPPAYQVIKELLENAQKNKNLTVKEITEILQQLTDLSNTVINISDILKDDTFLTVADETTDLPNSVQLLPGTNITFNDTIPNKRIISAVGGQGAAGPPGMDGKPGRDSFIPGPPGNQGNIGNTGPQGPIGPSSILVRDGKDGRDSFIPGPQGIPGLAGAAGSPGTAGLTILPRDGRDGRDSFIPGPTGPPGTNGIIGSNGLNGPPGRDGINGRDSFIPGPLGNQGATGATGTAGINGTQPDELIALIGRSMKRVWFLEQALGVDYRTPELDGIGVPSDAELIALEEIDLINDVINVTYNQRLRTFGITIDGGGIALTTGTKGFVQVPYSGTIIGWTLLATDGSSGSVVVDVYKDIYNNFPPNAADSITGGNKPSIIASNKNTAFSVPGWNAIFSAGDIFGFNVDSATTITRVTLEIVALIS